MFDKQRVEASLRISIEIEGLNLCYEVYYVNAAEIPGEKKEWNQETLYLRTPKDENPTPGYSVIKVRIRGEAVVVSEGSYACIRI